MGTDDKMIGLQLDIKHRAEDYRDYLEGLKSWEDGIKKRDKSVGQKNRLEADYPPVRGTVPETEVLRQQEEKERDDPVVRQKDLGNEMFKKGKFEEALKYYSKGIQFDPDGAHAHILHANRAMANIKLQRYADAEKDATACVQLCRTYVKGFFRRAHARRELGKLREASTDIETVLVLEPDNRDAKRQLAEIQGELKRIADEARRQEQQPQRKRVAIEEVDDDDDDDDEGEDEVDVPINRPSAAAPAAAPAPAPAPAPAAAAAPAPAAAPPAAAGAAGRKVVIEEEDDDEDEVEVPINRKPAAGVPTRHADPAAPAPAAPPASGAARGAAGGAAAPAPKGKKAAPLLPREAARKAAEQAVASSAEAVPTSFPHFERVWTRVRGHRTQSAAYLRLVPAEKYSEFFRTNITEDILHDVAVLIADIFLGDARQEGDAARALGIFRNIVSIERLSALLLFLPDEATEKLQLIPKRLAQLAGEAGAGPDAVSRLHGQLAARLDD